MKIQSNLKLAWSKPVLVEKTIRAGAGWIAPILMIGLHLEMDMLMGRVMVGGKIH